MNKLYRNLQGWMKLGNATLLYLLVDSGCYVSFRKQADGVLCTIDPMNSITEFEAVAVSVSTNAALYEAVKCLMDYLDMEVGK